MTKQYNTIQEALDKIKKDYAYLTLRGIDVVSFIFENKVYCMVFIEVNEGYEALLTSTVAKEYNIDLLTMDDKIDLIELNLITYNAISQISKIYQIPIKELRLDHAEKKSLINKKYGIDYI
jgi:uncharacterized UBP type Zn finger protein